MGTPTVIEVDVNSSMPVSPLTHLPVAPKRRDVVPPSTRSRRSAIEKKNLQEMRSKYSEAKHLMDEMKQESELNKQKLQEMSSVISALQNVDIDYDHDDSDTATSPVINVERKIRAMDDQLKSAVMHCGHLEQEKKLQTSTIKAQEGQIKTMEQQINALQQRLGKVVEQNQATVLQEKKTPEPMNDSGHTDDTIQEQERKIAALEDQLRRYSEEKKNAFNQQLAVLSRANEAKYKEIFAMDKQLESLRSAQQGQSTEMVVYDPANAPKSSKHVRFDPVLDDMEESHAGTNSSSDSSTTTRSSNSSSDQSSASSESGDGESAQPDEFDFIKVSLSSDESVELTMTKPQKASDDSYSTSSSTRSPVPSYEKEYQEAMTLIDTLRLENEKLRKDRSVAISDMAQVSDITASAQGLKHELISTKKALEEQKQSSTLANAKYEKLRREHAKAMEFLAAERQKHKQLMADYDKVAHRDADMEAFENLKKIHSAVVMKMAEMGEENDKLTNALSKMRSELSAAESKARDLKTELEATKEAYEDLQNAHAGTSDKLEKMSHEQDLLKAKYFESLAGDASFQTSPSSNDDRYNKLRKEYELVTAKLRSLQSKQTSNENLRREHSETLSKVEVLEATIMELREEKASSQVTQSRVDTLERAVEEANKRAATAKKREEKRASHLKDMLTHYKRLESEHEELTAYVKHLRSDSESGDNMNANETSSLAHQQALSASHQAKVESLERRIKELQQQRDASLEQVAQLEDELSRTRLEFREADEARQAREADLKTMLGHYQELQKQMKEMTEAASAEEAKKEEEMVESTVEASEHTANTTFAATTGDINECPDDEKSGTQEVEDKQLASEKPETEVELAESVPVAELEASANDASPVVPEDDIVHKEILNKQDKEESGTTSQESEASKASNVCKLVSMIESSEKARQEDQWKDIRIAKLLRELEIAKSKVWASEEKERDAQTQLETTERKLATALRESEDAKKRQNAREGNLRDAVALQKKMEKDQETFQATISDLEQQLEKAKMEIKLREEETKAARKRATGYHNQFKKLQEKYEECQKLVTK